MNIYYNNKFKTLQNEYNDKKIPTDNSITILCFKDTFACPENPSICVHKEILELSEFYRGLVEVTKCTNLLDFRTGELKFSYSSLQTTFDLIYSIKDSYRLRVNKKSKTFKDIYELLNLLNFDDNLRDSILDQIKTLNIITNEPDSYEEYKKLISEISLYINTENMYICELYKQIIYNIIKNNLWNYWRLTIIKHVPENYKEMILFHDRVL